MNHPGVEAAFRHWSAEIARWSPSTGRTVYVPPGVLRRSADSPHHPDRSRSANGTCRLLQARDGWIALNLPGADDMMMVPALLGQATDADPWPALATAVAGRCTRQFLAQAHLLGLAGTRVGETQHAVSCPVHAGADDGRATRPWSRPPRVLDLSALWAGPLASALLARAGCEVVRVDGRIPPDGFGQVARPGIGRLDDGKRIERFALDDVAGQHRLHALLANADVVLTGMRRRAIDALGLEHSIAQAGRDRILWVAITAHGLDEAGADRVGFGDDCAAAGELVDWTADGRPLFTGDAIADPLTGLRAAALALRALARREGGRLDVTLASTAADAVHRMQHRKRAATC